MDKPTSIERVQHILDAIQLIGQFVEGENEVTFVKDVKLQSAVQYQFLIIGEAIKHIDNGILLKYNYLYIYNIDNITNNDALLFFSKFFL